MEIVNQWPRLRLTVRKCINVLIIIKSGLDPHQCGSICCCLCLLFTVSRVWHNNKNTPEPRCQLVGTGEERAGDTRYPAVITSHSLMGFLKEFRIEEK